MPPEPTPRRLEQLDRRPLLTFFSEERLTSGRINVGIAAIGLMALVGVAIGGAQPIVLIFTAAAALLLWRNFRRFRQRVRAALAHTHSN